MRTVYTWSVLATYTWMEGKTTVRRDLPIFTVIAENRPRAERQVQVLVRELMDRLGAPSRKCADVRCRAIEMWPIEQNVEVTP